MRDEAGPLLLSPSPSITLNAPVGRVEQAWGMEREREREGVEGVE